jgi:hypothetical protein
MVLCARWPRNSVVLLQVCLGYANVSAVTGVDQRGEWRQGLAQWIACAWALALRVRVSWRAVRLIVAARAESYLGGECLIWFEVGLKR